MPEEAQSKKYLQSFPSDQNALDIFKGEWSSKLPADMPFSTGGKADLFEDQRIMWAQSQGIDFAGKRILELGPLEAAHTWMMENLGAREIVAIEANRRCFLKCLVIKEVFALKRCRFLHGDFESFLQSTEDHFDICLASGVLYHSTTPQSLLVNICRACDGLILWTHYFDDSVIYKNEALRQRFSGPVLFDFDGETHRMHPFHYTDEVNSNAFCGGMDTSSRWLEKPSIDRIIRTCGFRIMAEGFDHPNHPNGPAIAFVAKRQEQ